MADAEVPRHGMTKATREALEKLAHDNHGKNVGLLGFLATIPDLPEPAAPSEARAAGWRPPR